jgi:hypothetical protein
MLDVGVVDGSMKPIAAPGSEAFVWAMNEISSWSTISSGNRRSVGSPFRLRSRASRIRR